MRRAAVGAVVLLVGLAGMRAQAAIPEVISFQGKLSDSAGDPVTVATDVEFNLYAADTGGPSLWTETHAGVTPDANGLCSVMLGATSTFAAAGVDFTAPLWLGVTVGGDAEMTPRFELGTVPYAMNADTVDGQHAADLAETDTLQTVCTRGNSVTDSTSPVLYVETTSTGFQARAIEGRASSATGVDTWGVYGSSDSESGVGVRGLASAATGTTRGVHAQSDSTSGYGVYGDANAASGLAYGVYGISRSTSGCGVCGSANAGSGTTYGVYGRTTSTSGYDFYAGGAGTNYAPFTGAHEVRLSGDFPKEVRAGTVVSVTGETATRRDAKGGVSISSTLPTVRLSYTDNDSAVLGVVVAETTLSEDHWYEAKETDRFATVNALGEGRVWVTDIAGEVRVGDYITTSPVPGYAQKQDDDLLHSYTIGKVIESVDLSSPATETVEHDGRTYRAHLIAVVYTSG